MHICPAPITIHRASFPLPCISNRAIRETACTKGLRRQGRRTRWGKLRYFQLRSADRGKACAPRCFSKARPRQNGGLSAPEVSDEGVDHAVVGGGLGAAADAVHGAQRLCRECSGACLGAQHDCIGAVQDCAHTQGRGAKADAGVGLGGRGEWRVLGCETLAKQHCHARLLVVCVCLHVCVCMCAPARTRISCWHSLQQAI